jgi:hypothetical protein
MRDVLIVAVGAATLIMALALLVTPNVDAAISAIRDVLPFATGLIGFAGVVAALFGKGSPAAVVDTKEIQKL